MRKLFLIGIGPGRPEQVTVEAIEALNHVEVVFVLNKGAGPAELTRLRQEICERYITERPYRIVEVPDPPRDRKAEDYKTAVDRWTAARADALQEAMRTELGDDGAGGLLVWGDPAFYDSSLRVVERIVAKGEMPLDYKVIPGISSIQALAAAHRTTLTRVGRPLVVTTGRRLRDEGFPAGTDDVVVMLDGECTLDPVAGEDVQVLWGAYLSTDDEILAAGPVDEVAGEISKRRRAARSEKGWIMDTYLLRRR